MSWGGGELPPEAMGAFLPLKCILCSALILALPDADKQYAPIVDASTGAQFFDGGLGAILTQIDPKGHFTVMA